MIICPNFQNCRKFQKLTWQFDSHVQSACFVENQVVLCLKLYSWWRFPRTLIFGPNQENMTSLWRHLRSTYQTRKIPLIRVCEIDEGRGMLSLVAISPFFIQLWEEKWRWGGGVSAPTPSGRGLRVIRRFPGGVRPETILVRFEMALSPKDIEVSKGPRSPKL